MNLSEQLQTLVETYLPEGWDITRYTTEPDVLSRPLVMIEVKSITPQSFAVLAVNAHLYVLQPPRATADGNEQAADDALPFLLDVLYRVEAVETVTASRGMFLEQWPCWDIELNLYAPIVGDDEEPEEA